MRNQSIEKEKRKRIGGRQQPAKPSYPQDSERRMAEAWKGEEGWGRCMAPSVSNLEANFPIKRPGRQDNCSSDVTLDSAESEE